MGSIRIETNVIFIFKESIKQRMIIIVTRSPKILIIPVEKNSLRVSVSLTIREMILPTGVFEKYEYGLFSMLINSFILRDLIIFWLVCADRRP